MIVRPNIEKQCISDKSKSNIVKYWGFFSQKDIDENNGNLLMLDIDFGRKCSLNCPSCFRKKNKIDDYNYKDLEYFQILNIIEEAKNLGLREVKICGAGEPFENFNLINLAESLTKIDIGLSIFTKGHVLGDDNLVKKYFYNQHKIKSGFELAKKLYSLKTSVLVSCQSFNAEIQDQLVGNVKGFYKKRNRAIEILCEVGFNKSIPTRIALAANPIVKENYNELFEIYKFCRERNILPVNAALMTSGKQFTTDFLKLIDVSDEQKIKLFEKIYNYDIWNGFNSINQIQKEGISCMPGIHPCNQIAVGLYITSNGNVIRCPGDFNKPIGNVWNESITEIWNKNRFWRYSNSSNVGCPYKEGITLPINFQKKIKLKLNNYENINA